MTLKKESNIYVGRKMIKRTFQEKGISYASELAADNIRDMIEIIKWNHRNGITLYRMSSDMFPWMSEYEFTDLPNYKTIKNLLKGAGQLAKSYGQRLTFHPGPFNVLASPNENVVKKALKDLRQHSEIMDMLELPQSPEAAINIHIGGTYDDKEATKKRFAKNFKRLVPGAANRLVIENDDKTAQYSVQDLYDIHLLTGKTPITFDYHHHWCYEDPMPEEDALKLAAKTWPKGIRQLCHYSSCKQIYEDESQGNKRAHADYVYDYINTYGMDLDIELEAKAKELALLQYVNEFAEAV
jgi:UV DNA damage endonuclease